MAHTNKRKRESPTTENGFRDFTFAAGVFRNSKRRRQNCLTNKSPQEQRANKLDGSGTKFCVGKSTLPQQKLSLRKRFSKRVSEHIIKSKLKKNHDYSSMQTGSNFELLQKLDEMHPNCFGYGINTDFLKLSSDQERRDNVETEKIELPLRSGSLNAQAQPLQQRLEHEIKLREGATNLLAVSSAQSLDTARSLLLSNAKIDALQRELSSVHSSNSLNSDTGIQQPCKARLCVSDIRIPLMWKDKDHFKNEGDHRRYAVFCILKVGADIQATQLVRNVDRSLTDLTFSDVNVFSDVTHDFQLNLEVYCHKQDKDFSIASTPIKIKKKLAGIPGSVGRRLGKTLAGLNSADITGDMILGPKFHLLAKGTLQLDDADDSVGTHKLETLKQEGDSFCGVPLFGHYCCRLAVQPLSPAQPIVSGFLKIKSGVSPDVNENRYWCVLRNKEICCWHSTDKVRSDNEKTVLSLSCNTKVDRVFDSVQSDAEYSELKELIITDEKIHHLVADHRSDLLAWSNGLDQQFLDMRSWGHAHELCMEILDPFCPTSHVVAVSKHSSIYEETPLLDE